jgi:hypothetical protein
VIRLASIDEFRCLCCNAQVPDAVIGHAHATGGKLRSRPHVRSRRYNASLSPMTSKSSKPLSASSLISSIIPCQLVSTSDRSVNLVPYIGHNWLSIHPFHISEWHLGALMLSEFKLRIIHEGNLVETDYSFSFSDITYRPRAVDHDARLSWTIILVTRTAVSVVICFGPKRRPA